MSTKKKKQKKNILKRYIKKIQSSKSKFTLSETLTIMIVSILVGILIGSTTSYRGDSITVSKVPESLEEFISTYNDIIDNYYMDVDKEDLLN